MYPSIFCRIRNQKLNKKKKQEEEEANAAKEAIEAQEMESQRATDGSGVAVAEEKGQRMGDENKVNASSGGGGVIGNIQSSTQEEKGEEEKKDEKKRPPSRKQLATATKGSDDDDDDDDAEDKDDDEFFECYHPAEKYHLHWMPPGSAFKIAVPLTDRVLQESALRRYSSIDPAQKAFITFHMVPANPSKWK